MKTPKASGALRRAPDPMPRYAHFARPTPLCYVGKIRRTRAGSPLDQILDPLLYYNITVFWNQLSICLQCQMEHGERIPMYRLWFFFSTGS